MTTIAKAFVRLEPRVDAGFERQTKSAMGRIAGLAAKAFAVGFAAKQTFDFFAGATKSAEAYASQQANTRKIIEQTGGAANTTQRQVAALTKELQNKTGVDDKVIQQGSNILLTFKNIANEAGRGNDIFDRTNSIMLDLAAVTGVSATSAATQLGKALNDPVKGVTALQRVGVSFTEKQKEQIAALVESGDTLKAQKLVLRELESQYGGTAEASADSTAKIAQVWEDAKERIGQFILPIIDRTADYLLNTGLPAFERFIDTISPGLEAIGEIAGRVFGGIGQLVSGDLAGFASTVSEAFGVGGALSGPIESYASRVTGQLSDAWAAARAAFTGDTQALGAAVDRLFGAGGTLKRPIAGFATFIGSLFGRDGRIAQFLEDNRAFFESTFAQIAGIVRAARRLLQAVIRAFIERATAFWDRWGDTIIRIAQVAWDTIKGVISGALRVIRGIIDTVTAIIEGDWRGALRGLQTIAQGVWDAITAIVRGALRAVAALVSGALSALLESWRTFRQDAAAHWRRIGSSVTDTVGGWIDSIVDLFGGLPGRIAKAVTGIGKTIREKVADVIAGIKINLPFGFSIGGGDGLGLGAADGSGSLLGISENSAVGRFYRSIGSPGTVISGYRNSLTRSGKPSYHAGRALDFWPVTRDMVKLIIALGGSKIKELISPWADLGILNGKPHRYSAAVQGDHDGTTNVPHVHLAMNQGGYGTVRRPTPFVAGEGTGAEDYVFAPHRKGGLAAMLEGAGGRGRRSLTVHVRTLDEPRRIARAIADELAVADLIGA